MNRAAFIATEGAFSGWAARFLLMGWDVALAPGARRGLVEDRLARSQLAGLFDRPLPTPGQLIDCASLEEALAGAQWVMGGEAPGTDPGAIIVGDTVQVNGIEPVDLIPAVEVFGPDSKRAINILRDIGCDPVETPGGVLPALSDALGEAARSCVGAGASAEAVSRLLGHGLAQTWALSGPHRAEDPVTRDGDLTAIMRALKWQMRSVGAELMDADRHLGGLPDFEALDLTAPIPTLHQTVPADWADYNGHMTEARYLDAFGRATDRFMQLIGCTLDYVRAGQSFFTAETHICHLAETKIGELARIETQLIAAPGRKMHLFHRLWAGDTLRATGEHVLIHVSLDTRRACPFGDPLADRLAAIMAQHSALPRPDQAGRAIE